MYTSEILEVGTVDRSKAALMAIAPSCGAETDVNDPLNYELSALAIARIGPSDTYNANWSSRRAQYVSMLVMIDLGGRKVLSRSKSSRSQSFCSQ
jgi:hypothetical protein